MLPISTLHGSMSLPISMVCSRTSFYLLLMLRCMLMHVRRSMRKMPIFYFWCVCVS